MCTQLLLSIPPEKGTAGTWGSQASCSFSQIPLFCYYQLMVKKKVGRLQLTTLKLGSAHSGLRPPRAFHASSSGFPWGFQSSSVGPWAF